jgi:hypoxanthine phosphoribosyltransferase
VFANSYPEFLNFVPPNAAMVGTDSVRIHDKQFRILLKAEEIQKAVQAISRQLNADLQGEDVVFLAILNGSFLFAADLIRHIEFHCRISFVKVASYEGVSSSGSLKQLIGLNDILEDKTVVIVEDIVDSGNTLHSIMHEVQSQKPADLKVATLLLKPDAYEYSYKIDYVGFRIPNRFVVGYGLDYDGLGRNFDSIYAQVDD